MAGLNRRLELLEGRSQELAAEEVRRAWHRLTDVEIARVVAPFRFAREPFPKERAAQGALHEEVPEELIARAIALRAGMAEGEIARRVKALVDPVLERRRPGVLR